MPERFWVIFDTCQFPQYYQDVHNLLALSDGATMRYDYKRKYLSDEAIEVADRSIKLPILFIYAQKECEYTRANGNSAPPEGQYKTRYITTRIGQMLSVTKDAESYYFDFAVTAYPRQSVDPLRQILASLEERNEVPWRKWVCVSRHCRAFEELQVGDDQNKWSEIVELLSTPPMQFAGDAFWRIKGPFAQKGQTPQSPKVDYFAEAGRSRQARSYFEITENDSWRLELISETTRRIIDSAEGTMPYLQHEVEATTSDSKILSIIGSATYDLRHYTAQMVDYQAQPHPVFGQAAADLTLKSKPQSTDWPVGAKLTVRHRLKRNKVRMVVGCLVGILGTLCFIIGDSRIIDGSPWVQGGLKAIGVLLFVLSGFVLTGTLVFKS